jgi:hypothetical protein
MGRTGARIYSDAVGKVMSGWQGGHLYMALHQNDGYLALSKISGLFPAVRACNGKPSIAAFVSSAELSVDCTFQNGSKHWFGGGF